MSYFANPCPDCRSTTDLHDPECEFGGRSRSEIERAYADVLSVLSAGPRPANELRRAVPGEWTALHDEALARLRREHRVEEDGDALVLLTPEERTERISTPTHDPLRTVYEEGTVPGCHDNGVFAMIAYYEMVGLSWEETRERTVEWLRESGTWSRGGFEEDSPEQLVDDKRHVYDAGYGWKEKATAAKRVIERRA